VDLPLSAELFASGLARGLRVSRLATPGGTDSASEASRFQGGRCRDDSDDEGLGDEDNDDFRRWTIKPVLETTTREDDDSDVLKSRTPTAGEKRS